MRRITFNGHVSLKTLSARGLRPGRLKTLQVLHGSSSRKERLRRYVHLGTGNYNPRPLVSIQTLVCSLPSRRSRKKSRPLQYTHGFSLTPTFKKLLVAPFTLHNTVQKHIRAEMRSARVWQTCANHCPGNTVDQETIDNLYLASQAGVKVDLIVRGTCNLVPNIRG